MAPDDLGFIFCWILFMLKHFAGAATRIEVSVRGEPITVNSLLVVQCQVWDVPDRAMITIELEQQERNGGSGSIVDIASGRFNSGSGITINQDADRRYYLSTRRFPDGSTVYFLTITEVTVADEGRYTCTSFSPETRRVEADWAVVKLHYFPSTQYPVCSDTPRDPIKIPDNSHLTLSCSTNMGNPPVNISWHHGSDNKNISNKQWKQDFDLISELRYTLTMEDQGAVFICRIASDMFWGRSEICQVGPLRLISDEFPEPPPVVNQVPAPPSNTAVAGLNCKQETCERSLKVHILIIAIGFTTILFIVFLITTIIMCYKVKEKRVKGVKGVKQQQNGTIARPLPRTLPRAIPRTVLRQTSAPNTSVFDSGSSASTYGYVRTPTTRSAARPRPASIATEPIYMTLEPPEPANNRNSICIPKEIYDKYTLSIPRNVVISKL